MKTGIYIHYPFCRAKCAYCSFVSQNWDESLAGRYCRALTAEIEECAGDASAPYAVDSVYIGGGTPTLMAPHELRSILETCRRCFDLDSDAEISMEANPGTLSGEKLRVLPEEGINRVSLGAQSFCDAELDAVGRIHDAADIISACTQLRDAGVTNLNLDLMLGLPGQTESQWAASLQSAVGLAPSHLSIYMLELDGKVPLHQSVLAGRCHLPDEESVADWYLQAIDFLAGCGLRQYEISNFAAPGCECRHNLKYWRREPVLGFGVSAHSYDGRSRRANHADLPEYLGAVEAGRSPVLWREALEPVRELEESLFLGLRLSRGLDWEQVCRKFEGKNLAACETPLHELAEAGLIQWQGSTVRLTPRGMLLSNEVFQRFVRLDM
jgi:oxygen-independent coproporphyrinogen III oxidase